MRNVDFLPAAYHQMRLRRALRLRRLMLGVVILGLLAGWLVTDQVRVHRARGRLAELVRQSDTVQGGLEQIAGLQAEQALLMDKYHLLQDLQPSVSSVGLLLRIAHLLPEQVALRQLQLTCAAAAQAATAAAATEAAAPALPRVCLAGIAPSQVDIAVLVGQLSGCREFANVRLDYSKAALVQTRHVQEFRITFDVLGQALACAHGV